MGPFIAIWLLAVAVDGDVRVTELRENIAYADRAACEQSLLDHRERILDVARGILRAPWSLALGVAESRCEPKGEPA